MWLNSSTTTTHVAHTLSFHLLLIISQFPHLPPITITTSKEDERLSQDYCDPRVFVLATPPRVWYHIWEVTWDNRWTWTVLRSSLTPSSPAQSNLLLLFVSGFLRWTFPLLQVAIVSAPPPPPQPPAASSSPTPSALCSDLLSLSMCTCITAVSYKRSHTKNNFWRVL